MAPAQATDAAQPVPPAPGRTRDEPPDRPGREAIVRLDAALDRIATALVRQAEAQAERRDDLGSMPDPKDQGGVDQATLAEMRDRLDRLIVRVQQALDDAQR